MNTTRYGIRRCVLFSSFFVLATLVLLPETVNAAPRYSASIIGVETVNDSPTPVFLTDYFQTTDVDSVGDAIGVKTRGGQATAGYGGLHANSYADYLNVREFFPNFSGSLTGAQESSNFFLDDLVITGPPGNIMVSFNLAISGGLIATGNVAPYGVASGRATARIINLQSSGGGSGYDLGEINVDSNGGHTATGIFSSFPVNSDGMAMFTTPTITTFAGDTALQFWLGLETSAAATVGYGAPQGSVYGSSSFTFGFPTSGPVANLPAGYTLNSADGRIVDNRFVAPEPAGDYNGNGTVDAADYTVWRDTLGSITDLAADGDAGGTVDAGDFAVWTANFGATADGVGAASRAVPSPPRLGGPTGAVPEPSVLWLALAAIGIWPRLRVRSAN